MQKAAHLTTALHGIATLVALMLSLHGTQYESQAKR